MDRRSSPIARGRVGDRAGARSSSVRPLAIKKISDKVPLSGEFTPDRCYYWCDEESRLCIAMAFENVSLIGDYGKRSMVMSLVLGEMPAGMGRTYRVTRSTLRMISHAAPKHTRWASLSGIVGVWRDGDKNIRGRFRIFTKQQTFHIALGWRGGSRALAVGEFLAVPGEEKGRQILEDSEARGMERFEIEVGRRGHAAPP